MSIGGIQFKTTQSIPIGTLLDLWVNVSSRPGKFFLAGEVRWSQPTVEQDENGRELHFIGVQLKSGAATDILDWRGFQHSLDSKLTPPIKRDLDHAPTKTFITVELSNSWCNLPELIQGQL
jgi:Tfp pilus assembly protein PilZ